MQNIKEFIRELNGKRVEGELIRSIIFSLLASAIIFSVLYFTKLNTIENFIPKYGLFIFLSVISYAFILPSVRQVRAYKEFPCMSGMMIGMTVGMISSFLPGFFIGATNGMFWGSVFGMIIGILLGTWMGSSCGIMGFMEGLMAGFMGGLMGAMTAVMTLNDNLQAAAIIVFIISATILSSLNLMIFIEARELKREKKENYLLIILLSAILTLITIWFMIFGPRSMLVQ